jgi:hypothetical protein
VNATDAVMQVLADEGLLADVSVEQELRIQATITATLGRMTPNA